MARGEKFDFERWSRLEHTEDAHDFVEWAQHQPLIVRSILHDWQPATLLLTPQARVVLANQAMGDLMGVAPAHLVGQFLHDTSVTTAEALQSVLQAQATGDRRPFMLQLRDATGREFRKHVISSPIHSSNGVLLGTFTIFVDSEPLPLPSEGLSNEPWARLIPQITERESEIVALFIDGMRSETIANSLKISVYTVRNHLKNVCRKARVAGQAKLREYLAPTLR